MDSYSFEILHEKVSDEDYLADKTHEKAADNIFRIILSSPKAATIGLEGTWGSGKSTVVNLLQKKFKEEGDKTLVYLFDAWAHDGDPLRRIFLEGLVDDIDINSKREELQDIRNKISGNKKTVDVTTWKSASKLGGRLSASAIFVPVGASLLSAIDLSTVYAPSFGLDFHKPLLLGLFLSLAPLWVLVCWRLFSKDNQENNYSFMLGRKDWDVFSSTSKENYTQDITEDGERTSIEFEEYFNEIMECVVGSDKDYERAIIVIDNLDRIDPEKTLSVWSILQTFFQYRNYSDSKENWRDKLWFLIPYDKEALARVWADDIDSENTVSFNVNKPRSFFEKCFQLVEEVPEPVMTSWVEYLESRVEYSLNGWPNDSRKIVIESYKRYESSLIKSPTPRMMHSFINKVGVLGFRWGDSVSPEAISVYALMRRNRTEREFRTALLNLDLPDSYQSENTSQLKSELAGLLFGVDRNKGIQLLLQPEIIKALNDGDSEAISGLIEEQGEAFWVVWHSAQNVILPSNPTDEYLISLTIAFCKGTQKYKDKVKIYLNDLVELWKVKGRKWELDKYDYAQALIELCSVLDKDFSDFSKWLHKTAENELKVHINNFGKEGNDPKNLKQIRLLMNYLISKEVSFDKKRYVNLNAQSWPEWVEVIREQGLNFPEVLPAIDTVATMIETIDSTHAGSGVARNLLETFRIDSQPSCYPALVEKITQWMTNSNRDVGLNEPFQLLVDCYANIDDQDQDKIKHSLINQIFINRTEQENLENIPALQVLYSIVFDNEVLSNNIPSIVKNLFQDTSYKNLGKMIFSNIASNGWVSCIWEMARDSNNKYAINVIKSGDEKLYKVNTGAIYFDEYQWAEDEDLQILTEKFIENNTFESLKDEYLKKPNLYSNCLQLLCKYGGRYGEDYVNNLLASVPSDLWIESIKDETDLYLLLNKKGNHEFKDAVKEFALTDLNQEQLAASFWSDFVEYYNRLPDKGEVLETIAKKYFSLDHDPFDDTLFNCVLAPLSQSSISRISKQALMSRIELWLSNNSWDKLRWLLKYTFPVSKKPNESLISRLQSYSKDEDAHAVDIIERIAERYSIPLFNREMLDDKSKN